MGHTVQMIRDFYPQYNDCAVAAISPCYAKRREFDGNGRGDYNVTMRSIHAWMEGNGVRLPNAARCILCPAGFCARRNG